MTTETIRFHDWKDAGMGHKQCNVCGEMMLDSGLNDDSHCLGMTPSHNIPLGATPARYFALWRDGDQSEASLLGIFSVAISEAFEEGRNWERSKIIDKLKEVTND